MGFVFEGGTAPMKHDVRLKVQQCISAVSSRFVVCRDFDGAVNDALSAVGRLSGAGRAYLFVMNARARTMDNTHEWCAPGVEPQIGNLQGLPLRMFPWWMRKLRAGKTIHIHNVHAMPAVAAAEKAILESQNIKSLLVFPVKRGKWLLGFMGLDNVAQTGTWRQKEIELLRVSSEIMGGALERRRMERALMKKQAVLAAYRRKNRELTSKILSAKEDEARRIAADLHDEAGNAAVMFGAELGGLGRSLQHRKWREAVRGHDNCRDLLLKLTGRLKEIAVSLRPPALQITGLDGALRQYFDEVEKRTKLRIDYRYNGKSRLADEHVAITVYRIIQEAIVNVTRHAKARTVTVEVDVAKDELRASIRDDGRGFDVSRSGRDGLGMLLMRERTESLGGALTIRAGRNRGTTVSVNIRRKKRI